MCSYNYFELVLPLFTSNFPFFSQMCLIDQSCFLLLLTLFLRYHQAILTLQEPLDCFVSQFFSVGTIIVDKLLGLTALRLVFEV